MDNTTSVTTTQEPLILNSKAILATGKENAQQLMSLVTTNKWSVNIKGKDYLQVEAWQTLGKFYGFTARTSDEGVKYIEYGTAKGFEAKAEIVNEKTGEVVGGATGICMDDEPNKKGWANYALSGMAQTRAISRAYRQMLSFVAVLAGYEATPFEEMEAVVIERETPTQGTVKPYGATDRTKNYMKALGIEFDEGVTQQDASKLIEAKKAEQTRLETPIEKAVFKRDKDTVFKDDDKNRILDDMAKESWKGIEE